MAEPKQPKREEIKPYKYGTEYNMTRVSRNTLNTLLQNNVCILSIIRRVQPPDKSKHPRPINARRRMLCCNNIEFLHSYNGRVKLSHFCPKGVGLPYDPAAKNLIATWDLLMIDYRVINMDDCYLNYVYPINDKSMRNMFWREIFNKTFYLMSSEEKYAWMNTW